MEDFIFYGSFKDTIDAFDACGKKEEADAFLYALVEFGVTGYVSDEGGLLVAQYPHAHFCYLNAITLIASAKKQREKVIQYNKSKNSNANRY